MAAEHCCPTSGHLVGLHSCCLHPTFSQQECFWSYSKRLCFLLAESSSGRALICQQNALGFCLFVLQITVLVTEKYVHEGGWRRNLRNSSNLFCCSSWAVLSSLRAISIEVATALLFLFPKRPCYQSLVIGVICTASASCSADALGPKSKSKSSSTFKCCAQQKAFQDGSASTVPTIKASPREGGLLQKTHQDLWKKKKHLETQHMNASLCQYFGQHTLAHDFGHCRCSGPQAFLTEVKMFKARLDGLGNVPDVVSGQEPCSQLRSWVFEVPPNPSHSLIWFYVNADITSPWSLGWELDPLSLLVLGREACKAIRQHKLPPYRMGQRWSISC